MAAERLLTGAPVSKAQVGSMPSRWVTAAAVSVAFPDRRKAAVVYTSASVYADGGRRHRISRLAHQEHWRFTGN